MNTVTKKMILLVGFLIGAAIIFSGGLSQTIFKLPNDVAFFILVAGFAVWILATMVVSMTPTKFPKR